MRIDRIRSALASTLCVIALLAGTQPARADLVPYKTGQWQSVLASGQGKPLIVHHREKLAAIGCERVVINHAHLGEMIEAALGDGTRYGVTKD